MIYLPDLNAQEQKRLMNAALTLAQWGLGEVAPNPSVGCILYKDGQIIGRGRTQAGGRPHGEIMALNSAHAKGYDVKGSTAFVTLEPCAHYGETPPCVEALIAAQISAISIAIKDPNKATNGTSIEKLQQAGIIVATGLMEDEARHLNQGFFLTIKENRPAVALKLATSMDGKLAYGAQNPLKQRWITGKQARQDGHFLRARYDAILVGAGTLRDDNPSLDCRLRGLKMASPIAVIIAGRNGLPSTAQLLQRAKKDNAKAGLFVLGAKEKLTLDKADEALLSKIDYIPLPPLLEGQVFPSPIDILKKLGEKGITRLLIEGGAKIATSFLNAGLVDEIYHYQARLTIGHDGLDMMGELSIFQHLQAQNFTLMNEQSFTDQDDIRRYYRKNG